MIINKHAKALYIIINIMYRHGVNNIQCNQLQLQITYKCMIKITQIIITIALKCNQLQLQITFLILVCSARVL